MNVKIVKYDSNAVIPFKTHGSDFCYDCTATSVKDMGDGRIMYGLGFGLQMNTDDRVEMVHGFHEDLGPLDNHVDGNYAITIRPRGSIHKTGLLLSNSIGTVDEDYTGEIVVVFYNIIGELPIYEVGDRICQIVFDKTEEMFFEVVDSLDCTERGDGKHGSTGK